MKKVKYDPQLATLDGAGRLTVPKQVQDRARQITKAIEADIKALPSDPASLVITEYDVIERHIRKLLEEFRPLHKPTKEQLDDLVREAAKPHAIEEVVQQTPTTITYGLSDGQTLLKVWKKTGRIAQVKLGGCTRK